MHRIVFLLTVVAVGAAILSAADQPPVPTIGKIMDNQVRTIEREFVPLVEAMPADKIDFSPATAEIKGEFKAVRTFGQQAKHVAAVMYMVAAAILEEKPPAEAGEGEAGPATVKTKEQIVDYVKGSFAYAHKALGSITDKNSMDMVKSASGTNKTPRVAMAPILAWHGFDHYGQMVVYARMNGVVPPASRK